MFNQMDEIKDLAGKVAELKNASMLNAKDCGDAALTQLIKTLQEIDLRLHRLETAMGEALRD